MDIKQLSKKWWFWLIVAIIVMVVLFAPLFNCHLMKISNESTVRQCQSLFDRMINGAQSGLLQ